MDPIGFDLFGKRLRLWHLLSEKLHGQKKENSTSPNPNGLIVHCRTCPCISPHLLPPLTPPVPPPVPNQPSATCWGSSWGFEGIETKHAARGGCGGGPFFPSEQWKERSCLGHIGDEKWNPTQLLKRYKETLLFLVSTWMSHKLVNGL